ncbi:hypothetical protein [Paenibacillus lautus]|jgi:hypothetical protein|uniref:hypothetical protein n=1 Tax=Paenibacillus lautus TaxID=1401 RepID=UPI000FDCADAA|nr:hypothetical protein [Paenibacillus lautus]
MQYLNVLLEPLDDENQAYFYGERLVIDYVLLTSIQREAEEVNKKLREEIYCLMNNIVGSLYINLFIVKVNYLVDEAILAFMDVCGNKRQVRGVAQKRLMVWVAEEDRHDFQIYGFYRLHP